MNTIPEMIADRRKAIRKNRRAFEASLPSQFSEFITRSKAKLPRDFVPWAPGVVIASDRLLSAAGYSPGPGARRPPGWRRQKGRDVFSTGFRSFPVLPRLEVRKLGEFWMIEKGWKVLVFTFGSMPVCTRSFQAAMRLAEYYAEDRLAFSLRWVTYDPDGIEDC